MDPTFPPRTRRRPTDNPRIASPSAAEYGSESPRTPLGGVLAAALAVGVVVAALAPWLLVPAALLAALTVAGTGGAWAVLTLRRRRTARRVPARTAPPSGGR
jgi:Flp pilus assembly protein TadB